MSRNLSKVTDLPEYVAIKAFRGSYVRTQRYINLFTGVRDHASAICHPHC